MKTVMDALPPFFLSAFLWILMTVEWTNSSYLSHDVARSICIAQKKFTETGNLVEPLKKRRITFSKKCAWFKKEENCNSDSNCFSKKTCEELEIPEQDNQNRISAPLIIGGRDVVPPNKYPSFALMRVTSNLPPEVDNDTSEAFPCGAFIVSESYVLTAQHCADLYEFGENVSILAARYNISEPEETEQVRPVVELIKHPNNTSGNKARPDPNVDIAIFRVDPPFVFNENISAVKLAQKEYTEGEFTLVGTGFTKTNPEQEPDLPQEVEIPMITRERCRELSDAGGAKPGFIQDHNICFSKDGVGGCFGDSGGPAYKIENGEQIVVGITQGGILDRCEGKDAVSVYVEVFYFLKWIEENISKPTSK